MKFLPSRKYPVAIGLMEDGRWRTIAHPSSDVIGFQYKCVIMLRDPDDPDEFVDEEFVDDIKHAATKANGEVFNFFPRLMRNWRAHMRKMLPSAKDIGL